MKNTLTFATLFVSALFYTNLADAASASPGGAVVVTLKGGSDNYISLPFTDESVGTGAVAAVGEELIVLDATTNPLEGLEEVPEFDERGLYFAEFTSGDLAGIRYDIIGYSNNTLFLETFGDNLRNHPAGLILLDDQVRIVPHWTLGQVFGTSAESLIIEPTVTPLAPADIVMLPDNSKIGTDKTPSAYYFLAGRGWRSLANPTADAADVLIRPGQGMIVRRRSAGDIQLVTFGNSRYFPFSEFVQGGDGLSANDNLLSLQWPDPVSLEDSGLTDTGGDGIQAFKSSPNSIYWNDILILFQPDSDIPELFYHVADEGWFRVNGSGEPVGEDTVINPGSAFYIRKDKNAISTDWFFHAD